ncbi:ElyC/SanA/YdcF family protein [Myroides sp. DF42-4-2]|uniref:SanA/YdcF family protein n=1 Tax=Myroides sp. DF42-4-2 TaxID=2746726 RepID=UPI002578BB39|nr:ElyC/SanA/YdcF family protein [Myroides sp. DF42-4-2]MDM1407765.1 YdcF family protein [Myroides sp. DF42-4-2]
MKKTIYCIGILCILLFVCIWGANIRVASSTGAQLFDTVEQIPHNKVGLVLGTSKYLGSGQLNYYFTYRIEAAAKLYHAGKIDFVVVSGDNSQENYNEPKDMEEALIERGVPKDHIYLDYAGLRTLDSVYRMKAIFNEEAFTIISQPFHNERAVFIANHLELQTVGFNAQDVTRKYGFKTLLREKFARVKVILDNLTNKKPKYLGPQILIGIGLKQEKVE